MPQCWKSHATAHFIWTSTRENLSSGVCEKQRRRPACASAQSDQRLCYSLSGEHSSQACSMQNFTFLASLCSLGDCFESHFVGKPEYRFCRNEALLLFQGTEKRNSLQPISGPKSKLQTVSAKSIAGEQEEKETRFVSARRPKQCQISVEFCLVDALYARIQKVLREGVQL